MSSESDMRWFSYDDAGRLIKYRDWTTWPDQCTTNPVQGINCLPNQGQPLDSMVYEWDAVGNPEHLSAVVDSANLLLEFDGFVMTYDDDHNLLTKVGNGDTVSFSWNSLGQLTSVTKNDTTTSFAYDGLGRRIEVGVTGGATIQYVWDGNDVAFEADTTGTAVAYYAHYPGIDRPHSLYRDGTNYHYVTDRRGNVTALMQGGLTRKNTYRYEPFGKNELSAETVASSLRWGGAQYDGSTALYYMRARYYDPSLQRFVTEDPIGLVGGMNVFAFANSNPSNWTDPRGTDPCHTGHWEDAPATGGEATGQGSGTPDDPYINNPVESPTWVCDKTWDEHFIQWFNNVGTWLVENVVWTGMLHFPGGRVRTTRINKQTCVYLGVGGSGGFGVSYGPSLTERPPTDTGYAGNRQPMGLAFLPAISISGNAGLILGGGAAYSQPLNLDGNQHTDLAGELSAHVGIAGGAGGGVVVELGRYCQ